MRMTPVLSLPRYRWTFQASLVTLLFLLVCPCHAESPWKIVWQDEFEGEALDLEKWKFETGDWGWGNKELQNYTQGDNASVSDGRLKITAKQIRDGDAVGHFTSARLNSRKSFTYGKVEVRAKMPEARGNGLWPAIWMLGHDIESAGWPDCGELDLLEYVSFLPDHVHSAVHSRANNHRDKTQVESGARKLETAEEAFHVYGLLWSETKLTFYIDQPDNVILTFDRPEKYNKENWPFDKPFYMLINIAVGGQWGGMKGVQADAFPATMEVDYVRVYQK